MTESKVWLIANPTAGRKGGVRINRSGPEEARHALERLGFVVEMELTRRAGHAGVLAQKAAAAGAEIVVAAGGDHTIREIAHSLIGTGTTLGVIPLGSFVNLARALGIPRDVDAAAEVIRRGHVVLMEVGRARTGRGEFHFLEAAGVGLDAGLLAYSIRVDAGKWRYVWSFLRFVARYRSRDLRLTIDGRCWHARQSLMISAAIGPYIGAALPLAPTARVDDRQLEIVVRGARGRADLIRHAAALLLGSGTYRPRTWTGRGRELVVEHVDRPAVVHADGEIVGTTPVHFDLLPTLLPVLASAEYASRGAMAPTTAKSMGCAA